MFTDFQRFSTFFNVFQRFSTIFGDFQRFLGARPYRGCSSTRKRKSANKCDTTPTEKPTGPPPGSRFSGDLLPFRFQAYFLFFYQCRRRANLGRKSIRQISHWHRDLFSHPNRIFPRQQCQFWANKANSIHGLFSKKTIDPAARPGLPSSARS